MFNLLKFYSPSVTRPGRVDETDRKVSLQIQKKKGKDLNKLIKTRVITKTLFRVKKPFLK